MSEELDTQINDEVAPKKTKQKKSESVITESTIVDEIVTKLPSEVKINKCAVMFNVISRSDVSDRVKKLGNHIVGKSLHFGK